LEHRAGKSFSPASTTGRNAVGIGRIEMKGGGTTNRSKQAHSGNHTDSKAQRPKTAEHIAFIRMLAHDLRNPISGILAASQCLMEDASLFLDEPHVTLLRAIESSSDLMLRLIEDMLEVARADSGALRLRPRPTDLAKLVDKIVAQQRKQADARGVRLKLTRDAEVPRVEVDSPRLRWAFNALLANTIRSSEHGGEVEIHIATRRKSVVLAVQHVGAGGPARAGDSRGGSLRGERRQARALTLSTARLIVEGHGGTIRVDQKATPPGYTVTLPAEVRKPESSVLKTRSPGG
jgi:signal transduction histidine kinase